MFTTSWRGPYRFRWMADLVATMLNRDDTRQASIVETDSVETYRHDDHAWLYEKPIKPRGLGTEVLDTFRDEASSTPRIERWLWLLAIVLHLTWTALSFWRVGPEVFVLMAGEVLAVGGLFWRWWRQASVKEAG